MQISPLAGKPAPQNILANIPKLITAYYTGKPDPSVKVEKISFGTSGHRGSSFKNSFNENHILAKTVVTTQLIERIVTKLNRKLFDVPVGFKWFAEGLLDASLCFGGEESAGASSSRLDGTVWTTDKDGFIPALLSAEITAKMGKDRGELYNKITKKFGEPFYDRIEAKATREQKEKLKNLSSSEIKHKELAGEKIKGIITNAPGNCASIGGIKVITENAWFAARPSGTEDIYKIYAESFLSKDHLNKIIDEAQTVVNAFLQVK